MADGHFAFQCKNKPKGLLDNDMNEVLEYLVYKGAHDLLINLENV